MHYEKNISCNLKPIQFVNIEMQRNAANPGI